MACILRKPDFVPFKTRRISSSVPSPFQNGAIKTLLLQGTERQTNFITEPISTKIIETGDKSRVKKGPYNMLELFFICLLMRFSEA